MNSNTKKLNKPTEIDDMAMVQEEERIIKLKYETFSTLPEGLNNPLKMIELNKENNNIRTEKEEINKAMNNMAEKAEVILGPKGTTTSGVEKKTRG